MLGRRRCGVKPGPTAYTPRHMGRRALVLILAAAATVVGTVAVLALPRERPPAQGGGLPPAGSIPPSLPIEQLYGLVRDGGGEARSYGEAVAISAAIAGEVVLPSGELVASDGMILDADPFTLTVQPGRYPVSLLVADFPGSGDHRVAAALVRVADGEPVDWQLALVDGQDASTLGPDEIFGYGVDSGSGAFTSPEAVAMLADEAAYERYSSAAFEAMFPDEQTIVDSAAVNVDPATGVNVVTFSSGFGDGVYATYAGLDPTGDPLVFLTDFGVLDAD